MSKKDFAQAKSNYDLHVLLVIRQDDVSKSKAVVTAYAEGAAGLVKRLA